MSDHPELPRDASPIPSGSSRRRRRHRHRLIGSATAGKLWLIAIFCAMRGSDFLIYFETAPGPKDPLVGSLITSGIWNTLLLVAIWQRQNWARYVLIAFQFLGVIGAIILVPVSVEDLPGDNPIIMVMIVMGLLHATIAWCLISSPGIRKLTNRT